MQSEIIALQREVAALKQQVQGKRKRFNRRVAAGLIVGLVAMIPMSLYAANPTFSDLNQADPVHQGNIQAIGNAGITTGFADPANPGQRTYNPKGLVTREEMASFLARTAGLGGNAPVANAATIQGFQANTLSRVGVASSQDIVFTLNSTLQGLTTVTVVAPGPGFVHIQGSVTLRQSPSGGAAIVTSVVGDNTTGFVSYPLLSAVGSASGYAYEAAASPTTVFRVSSAGTYSYSIIAGRDSLSTGTTYAQSATIVATYTPFGAGDAQGAENEGAVTRISAPVEVAR